jgi:hypothetical protein
VLDHQEMAAVSRCSSPMPPPQQFLLFGRRERLGGEEQLAVDLPDGIGRQHSTRYRARGADAKPLPISRFVPSRDHGCDRRRKGYGRGRQDCRVHALVDSPPAAPGGCPQSRQLRYDETMPC